MISLQQNLPLLQSSFFLAHEKGNQRNFDNYKYTLSQTSEIAGFEYRCFNGVKWYTTPLFMEGYDSFSLLNKIAGKSHALQMQKAQEKKRGTVFSVRNHWCAEDLQFLHQLTRKKDPVKIMEGAWEVAFKMLKRYDDVVAMICGPISPTPAGRLSKEDNLSIFHATMTKIAESNIDVFNQLPFEAAFARVETLLQTTHRKYLVDGSTSWFYIEHFYKKVIYANKRWKGFFINGWEGSIGASLEQRYFQEKKHSIEYLPEGFHLKKVPLLY